MPDHLAELGRVVGERLLAPPRAAAGAADAQAVMDVVDGRAGAVAAVVLYGSCLHRRTAAGDSEPDYFLVVDSLRRWHRGLAGAVGNALLPPSTYHARVHTRAGPRRCKVSVISTEQLAHETSPQASDLHHLGRFSKPLALLWARDDNAFRAVRDAQVRALTTLAPLARALLDSPITGEDFMLALLGISYLGEHRLAEPDKVRAILAADRAHLLRIGGLLLASAGLRAEGARFVNPPAASREEVERFIARSRMRALLRWPKYLLTFDGWLDYLGRKLERHTGRRLALTEAQRKHPLLLAWPELLALRRDGLLR